MSERLYLVLSARPGDVSEQEYDRWYHAHARENIEVPGFRAVRRYSAQPTNSATGERRTHHLALYEYEGDMAAMRAELSARVGDGRIVLPSWFDRIEFSSWDCAAIEPRVTPES